MSKHRGDSAIIFPNFSKKKPSHPDYRGKGNIGGVDYEISAWEKQGTRTKFLSIAFTVKGTKGPAQPVVPSAPTPESPTGSAEHEPIREEDQEPQPFIA
jgi:hypothetical protein